jgi:hypothetical protein
LAVFLVLPRRPATPTDPSVGSTSHDPILTGDVQHLEKVEGTQASPSALEPSPTVDAAGVPSASGDNGTSAEEAKHEAYVEARTTELQDLARKSDAASLATLLAEVRNPDPEIREAALDALSQSGNRSAIPALQQAAAQTADPGEKKAIQDVIEFLKLPTLTETLRTVNAGQSR